MNIIIIVMMQLDTKELMIPKTLVVDAIMMIMITRVR